MVDDLDVSATALQLLTLIFDFLFSVYLPVVGTALEEENYIRSNNEINSSLLTVGLFIRSYYQLLSLTATCAQANIPKLRIEGVLFPHFVGSEFRGRDFFSELERCQHLFWSLTGESVESFTRIVRDVGPTVYFQNVEGAHKTPRLPIYIRYAKQGPSRYNLA